MTINQDYLIVSSSVSTAKTGAKYVVLNLKGLNGESVKVNIWGASRAIEPGQVVKFLTFKDNQGMYSANLNDFTVNKLLPNNPLNNFLPKVPNKALWKSLSEECQAICGIRNSSDSEVIERLFDRLWDIFQNKVAARSNHHAHKGGLLQHTYEIVNMFVVLYTTNALPWDIDPFACIVGGLFQDYYKILEYDNNSQLTPKFFLEGHPTGSARACRVFLANNGYSEVYQDFIAHIVLSHHTKREYGSPVEPCTTEAMLMAHLDAISGHCTAINDCSDGQQCPSLGINAYKTKRQ